MCPRGAARRWAIPPVKASGDGGAYDVNNDLGCFGPYSSTQPNSCSLTLSVDYPGSDTAITAAGGTTLAVTLELCLNAACTPPYYTINIPHERVWGWDYFEGFCDAIDRKSTRLNSSHLGISY